MTVMKSLLLGSAATLVVVAGAQAADLPTKKGAPAAEYVKVCKVGDIAGFVIPGSDTCLKISGYVNAQIAMGNVDDEYTLAPLSEFSKVSLHFSSPHVTWGVPAMTAKSTATEVNDIGYYTRGQVNFDAVTNTAYGPLLAHIELQSNVGDDRFDSTTDGTTLNEGYVSWAGVTAGKHPSFYDYLAGGDTWKDFFSPDHSGTPINLLAYTATFGGGFSATVSLEQNESASGFLGAAADITFHHHLIATGAVSSISGTPLGVRAPDIVASLDVTQSWGGAHLAGVAHNDRDSITASLTGEPWFFDESTSLSKDSDVWGYGVIGGVTFNLPMLSAGSKIAFQGAYTDGAIAYSGATSPAWGEQDQGFNTNGNGLEFPMADGVFDPLGNYHKSEAWSVAGQLTWKVSPNFEIDPEISYASVQYDNSTSAFWMISPKATAWWVGAVFDWSPVKNLDFAFDAIYESSHQDTPEYWSTAGGGAFQNNADGFNGRIHVVRSF
jgi:hypothetical protein